MSPEKVVLGPVDAGTGSEEVAIGCPYPPYAASNSASTSTGRSRPQRAHVPSSWIGRVHEHVGASLALLRSTDPAAAAPRRGRRNHRDRSGLDYPWAPWEDGAYGGGADPALV